MESTLSARDHLVYIAQRGQHAVEVFLPDHEVEVVAGLGPAAGPRGEAAAQRERHAALAQRRGRFIQRRLERGERLLVVGFLVFEMTAAPRVPSGAH
jgi:hypothetical protein